MTTSKNVRIPRNILNQNKHKKVKDYLPITNEEEKTDKRLTKGRK